MCGNGDFEPLHLTGSSWDGFSAAPETSQSPENKTHFHHLAWTHIERAARTQTFVLTFSSRKVHSQFKSYIRPKWKLSTHSHFSAVETADVRTSGQSIAESPAELSSRSLNFSGQRECAASEMSFPPFINLLLPFLKQAEMLIKWAHKDFLSKRNGKNKIEGKRKIYKAVGPPSPWLW